MAQSAPLDLGIPGLEDAMLLGRGGFAVVYRAYQPAFRRTVAVKVVSVSHVDELTRERFSRECQAMGLLAEHPSIVTVLEAGFLEDGRPFLVMAYMPEGSLQDRLRRGPVGWQEATRIGVKLAGALGTAHQAGVLHRDVKPANVLVSQFGEPQLADFGIARVAGGQETSSGVITASLSYAPPEIVDGQRPSVASDVYSLGATIHALMTGSAPFWKDREDSVAALINRVMTRPPPDLRTHGVPGNIAEVLEQAMAKDPQERPSSAAQFGRLLRLAEDENGLRPTQMTVYKPADEPAPVAPPAEPPPTELAPAVEDIEEVTDSPTDVVDSGEMPTATAAAITESPLVEDEATAPVDEETGETSDVDEAATADLADVPVLEEAFADKPELPPTATVAAAASPTPPPEATADLVREPAIGEEPVKPVRKRGVWFAVAAMIGALAVVGGYLITRNGGESEAIATTAVTSSSVVGTTAPSGSEPPDEPAATTTTAVDTEPAIMFEFPEWWLADPNWAQAEQVDHATNDRLNFVIGDNYGARVWRTWAPPSWDPVFEDGQMTVEMERGETDYLGVEITGKRFWRAPTSSANEYAAVFRLIVNKLGDGFLIFLEAGAHGSDFFRNLALVVDDTGYVQTFPSFGDESEWAPFDLQRPITLEPGAWYDVALIAEGGGAFSLLIWPTHEPPPSLEQVAGSRLELGEDWTFAGGWDPGMEVIGGASISIDEYWGFELPSVDAAPSAIDVGMVMDYPGRSDQSFKYAAGEGLDRAAAELGINATELVANPDGSDREELVLQLAQESDLVIAVGWTFSDAVRATAEAYGDVTFAIVDDASIDLPNVSNLTFAEAEGSYLVGVAAGLKTSALRVGFLGGVDWELVHRFEAGFTAGVKAVDIADRIGIDVEYISTWPDTSGFDDAAAAQSIAQSMYSRGVDVIFHAAGGSGSGVFRAAREHSESTGNKVWAIGVDSDQYLTADTDVRPHILTSMLKRVDVAVFNTVQDVVAGTFIAGPRRFDLSVDGVDYATSGGFVDDIIEELEYQKTQISGGWITVPETR